MNVNALSAEKWHTLKGVKMTKEDYELAHDLVRDIETLENIQYSQKAQHWVNFTTADMPTETLGMYSTEFIDDFEEWVEAEIKKLEDKLSKL